MSIWNQERVPGGLNRHALGVWLTYRKTATAGYVPGRMSRAPLAGKVIQWYPVNFSLAARLNAEDRITTQPGFWLVYLIGSSSLAPGFRVQLYDSEKNQRLGDPLNFANELGTAQHPFILRKPHYCKTRSPILVRVQNQDVSGATNNIQVVAVGYGD